MFGLIIFITQFSSFHFRHSSLKIPYPFGTITHLSSLNLFHTVCGSHTCHSMQFFFFFSVSPNPVKKKKKEEEEAEERKRNPDQITETSERRRRRRKKNSRSKGRRRSHLVWKEKEKKKRWRSATKWRTKKKNWSKVAAKGWQWVPPCSVIYENVIELWVMETENS